MSGEFAFIDRIGRLAGTSLPAGIQVGIGDDCAVLDGGTLLALDTMVEGVHFRLDWCTPADAGWKAVVVNVSDVAAMGGMPTAVLVGLTMPVDAATGTADAVMSGVIEATAAFGCPLVGGDTTGGPTLVLSVAIVGALPPDRSPVLRRGASLGDSVFVTGMLGLATSALDHLAGNAPVSGSLGARPGEQAFRRLHRPLPRVTEGKAAADGGASAMIDVSDGLAADLGHICDASEVGVRIDAASVPLAPLVDLARALTGGDDYELCFTAPDPERVRSAFIRAGLPAPHRIGTITEPERGRILVEPDDSERPLPAVGWQHRI